MQKPLFDYATESKNNNVGHQYSAAGSKIAAMPSPYHGVEVVYRHTLGRSIHAITTVDASQGVLCRPEYADRANPRCSNHIAYTDKSWSNAVRQLLTIKQVYESAFGDEDTYLEALAPTLDLFVWVFCTCPMHHGEDQNTHEDWTKLYRVVSGGFDRGLRGDDLFEALLSSMNWADVEESTE